MTELKTTEQINSELILRLNAQAMEIIKLRQDLEEEKGNTQEVRNYLLEYQTKEEYYNENSHKVNYEEIGVCKICEEGYDENGTTSTWHRMCEDCMEKEELHHCENDHCSNFEENGLIPLNERLCEDCLNYMNEDELPPRENE